MQHDPDYLSSIRQGIAERLRDQSMLTEPLPDRFRELLAKLDRTDVPASGSEASHQADKP
jgi:Anti-sigma factor NepR